LYRKVVRGFLDALGSKAGADIRAVTAADVEFYQRRLIAEGLSATSIDKELRVVRSILKRAHDFGIIPIDPAKAVPSIAKRKGKSRVLGVTRETFTHEELDRIEANCDGEWKTIFLLARYTGARLGDCQRMHWSSVDLIDSLVTFTDEKTGKSLVVPIHARLREHLLSLSAGDNPNAYVSPNLAKKASGGAGGTSLAFRRIMRNAGVSDDVTSTHSYHSPASTGRTLAKRSFHSIRHTFNSALANNGVAQEVRQKLVGHASNAINSGYTHHELAVFRIAINQLP
jgi:integrase